MGLLLNPDFGARLRSLVTSAHTQSSDTLMIRALAACSGRLFRVEDDAGPDARRGPCGHGGDGVGDHEHDGYGDEGGE